MDLNQWVDELFEVFDEDNDGVINRSEFVELIDVLLQDKGIRMCETIFKRFDKNHDNSISKDELKEIQKHNALPFLERVKTPFKEITSAIKDMPKFMWQLSTVYLFQWYALFVYWQYITPLFMKTMGFGISEAASQSAQMSLTYNIKTKVLVL